MGRACKGCDAGVAGSARDPCRPPACRSILRRLRSAGMRAARTYSGCKNRHTAPAPLQLPTRASPACSNGTWARRCCWRRHWRMPPGTPCCWALSPSCPRLGTRQSASAAAVLAAAAAAAAPRRQGTQLALSGGFHAFCLGRRAGTSANALPPPSPLGRTTPHLPACSWSGSGSKSRLQSHMLRPACSPLSLLLTDVAVHPCSPSPDPNPIPILPPAPRLAALTFSPCLSLRPAAPLPSCSASPSLAAPAALTAARSQLEQAWARLRFVGGGPWARRRACRPK